MSGDGRRYRPTHDGWSRSPKRDSLAQYRRELEAADMDPELKAHLLYRLRCAMRAHRTVTERDFALIAERLYAVTVDPSVPAAERRRALSSWFRACKELDLVSRREGGSKGRRRTESVFPGLRVKKRKRKAGPLVTGQDDDSDAA